LRNAPPRVVIVRADELGGFSLFMTRQWSLEVFPADSERDPYAEWWRLFKPSDSSPHFVVSPRGIKR
jgi:hypothetical protein